MKTRKLVVLVVGFAAVMGMLWVLTGCASPKPVSAPSPAVSYERARQEYLFACRMKDPQKILAAKQVMDDAQRREKK